MRGGPASKRVWTTHIHVAIDGHQTRGAWVVARSILEPCSHRGLRIHPAHSLESVEEGRVIPPKFVLWRTPPIQAKTTSHPRSALTCLQPFLRSEEHTSELQSPMYLVC